MDPKNKINLPKNMSWEILKRFNTVTNSSSFIGAAKKIGTSKAALLNQLDVLEADIGKYLFVRYKQNRSLELTSEGQRLKEITAKLSRIIDERMSDLITSCQDDRKSIKIITTPGLATTLLASIVAKFLQENEKENVKFEIITEMSPIKINIGEIIIRHDFLPQENFQEKKLLDINLAFYASENYIKNYGIPQSYDDLINHKLLTIKYFNILNTDKYTLDKTSFIYIEPYLQSNYVNFLIEMALKDLGIIELPKYHPATKSLHPIVPLGQNTSSIYAGYLNIADQSKNIYNFINYLKDNIRDV